MTVAFPLRFNPEEDGSYWVQGLPPYENVLTEGKDLEHARLMAQEALSLVLEVMLDAGQAVPRPSGVRAADVYLIAPEDAVCRRLEAIWATR